VNLSYNDEYNLVVATSVSSSTKTSYGRRHHCDLETSRFVDLSIATVRKTYLR